MGVGLGRAGLGRGGSQTRPYGEMVGLKIDPSYKGRQKRLTADCTDFLCFATNCCEFTRIF